MKQERAERVAEAMQTELAAMLQREIKDPRVGFVSITRVDLARDLAVARVYVSVLNPEEADETLVGLRSARSFLRGEVARRLHLRQAPELEFRLDHSLQASLTVQRLLKQTGVESTGHAKDD
ncbi:MAG: 30S ribosome-binding factor RbfA [Clostridia bacterium]